MPRGYAQHEMIEAIGSAIGSGGIAALYKEPYIKRTGKTLDTRRFYSEVAAEALLHADIKRLLATHVTWTGRKDYTVTHDGKTNPRSTRDEEKLAIGLQGKDLAHLGKVIQYQVPLKSRRSDEGVGKIDLVSLSPKHDRLYIIELKAKDNREGLLRAVLEIATYTRQIDEERFCRDMRTPAKKIAGAVLLEKGSRGYIEYKEVCESGVRPNLKALIRHLGIEVFLLEDRGCNFVSKCGVG